LPVVHVHVQFVHGRARPGRLSRRPFGRRARRPPRRRPRILFSLNQRHKPRCSILCSARVRLRCIGQPFGQARHHRLLAWLTLRLKLAGGPRYAVTIRPHAGSDRDRIGNLGRKPAGEVWNPVTSSSTSCARVIAASAPPMERAMLLSHMLGSQSANFIKQTNLRPHFAHSNQNPIYAP